MSGSRLGRGRGGRLAVYGGCGVVVVLLVFLYRAATSEMARLRELHVQCAHQQEALAAQLQVIFEYKVRLEKSLAEEKSSNAAVKQELQQRASREKSLRDKDSIEAMQRFNSLQQTYKLLQTEHQDLQEECKKREKQASEDTTRLEKALEHLKTKFLELDTEKSRLKEKYDDVIKNSGNNNSTIDHLKKEVMQLKRELEQAKKSSKVLNPSPASSPPLQRTGQQAKSGWEPRNQEQPVGPSQQQQVSPPNNDDKNPQPLHAPLAHHAIGDPLQSNEQRLNEETNDGDVQFAQKNGNIVPVGPNEAKDGEVLQRPVEVLPQEKQYQKVDNDQSTTSRIVVHNIVTDSVHKTDNPKEHVKSAVPLDENSVPRTSEKVEEKLEKVHNNVDGILSQILRMI